MFSLIPVCVLQMYVDPSHYSNHSNHMFRNRAISQKYTLH